MPQFRGQFSRQEIEDGTGLTPAIKFFLDYGKSVDGYLWTSGDGAKYYHQECVFHNTNTADYTGPDQMWNWIRQIFGQFGALRHDIHQIIDIEQDDGTDLLAVQMTRNIWVKGSNSKEPEVAAPGSMWARIGKGDSPIAYEGLQFHEVWLYWDTMLLAPFMPKDAIAFQSKNVVTGK